MLTNAQLVLQTGEVFDGKTPVSQERAAFGEVVFNTGMVGYVESLTDPSYVGQLLVFTYPLIGNYGVPAQSAWESQKIHVSGVVVSELSPFYSHYQAERSLQAWLHDQKVPILTGVDTRALTKTLRTKGVVPGAIAPLSKRPTQFEDFEHINWVRAVTVNEPIYYGEGEKLIIAIDCGMKENILRSLLKFPVRIKRVPYDYDFTDEAFDGVFISNGPGDPKLCKETIRIIEKAMAKQKPIFGICLGTQLMALAAGAKTYKLTFGHRSHNQPCLHLPTNRAYLTSQNHGYAIDEKTLSTDWQVSFRNLNDQSVAGISHKKLPYFSVQFHPEAAAGPEDTRWLFQQFYDLLTQ
ncbi:MAG: carbamoyl phosphate synthase small subunit [Gammaproteobacteria bacterium RIFCSPHIGHO2_12_FULL_43_28]|nr:MAG: carbamoyl phosphate synthase small subunit [Gammaproteobacteria bacterium RIFCSPHIGHO2_12_FULL_43_28]